MAQDTHRFDPTAIREYDIRGIVGQDPFARGMPMPSGAASAPW